MSGRSNVLVLGGETQPFPNAVGAQRLENECAFTSRDMSKHPADAFTYGIVMGWDEGMEDVAAAHAWDADLVAFIRDAHARFKRIAGDS